MQLRRTLWFLTAGTLSLILTACPGPAATKGILEITVNAPSGVTPNVKVTGPGTDSTINSTGPTEFKDKDPGDYTVEVNKVVANGIGYNGTGATVKVEAGKKSTFNVDYAAISGKIQVNINTTGLPATLTPSVTISKNSTPVGTPLSASGAYEDVAPDTYTISVPSLTEGSSTYASAVDGTTVTVNAGEEAVVGVSYTLNPGTATITIAGILSGPTAAPVNVSLTPSGGSAITQQFSNNGPVTFSNLAPGSYTLAAQPATVGSGASAQDFAASLSKTTLSIASGGTDTATVTYSRPTVTVNLTGLPAAPAAANTVIALTGGPATVPNTTITGTARSATITVPRFGSYTVNATSIVAGTTVDSYFFNTTAVTASPSATTPAATAPNLAMTARGQSGTMFIAGNGTFAPVGLNAIYSLADAAIATGATLTNFLPATGTSSAEGYFKTVFDRDGNAYVIYQNFSGSQPARILRITEANLRAGNLTAAAAGNKEIVGTAIGVPTGAGGNEEVEPSDIAFDNSGNMWIANDNGSAIVCISNTQLGAAGSTISGFSQAMIVPSSFTGNLARTYTFVRALAFDRQGNLWFTSDDTVASDLNRRARLSRINASSLTCSGGVQRVAPDVLLDISNVGGAGGPIIKPAGLALAPDGNSLWVADYGGSSAKYRCETPTTGDTRPACPGNPSLVIIETAFVDANEDLESVIQINIAGISTGTTLRNAFTEPGRLLDRITIPAGAGTDRGLQQPFHMAFDKQNRLWLATNNNVIVTSGDTSSPCGFSLATGNVAVCLPSTALTDRRGKVYGLSIGSRTGSDPLLPFARNVSPVVRISSAEDGVGFTGVAFNIAPANAPMYVRPTQ